MNDYTPPPEALAASTVAEACRLAVIAELDKFTFLLDPLEAGPYPIGDGPAIGYGVMQANDEIKDRLHELGVPREALWGRGRRQALECSEVQPKRMKSPDET